MIVWVGNLKSYRRVYYRRYMGLPIDIVQYTDLFGNKFEFTFHHN